MKRTILAAAFASLLAGGATLGFPSFADASQETEGTIPLPLVKTHAPVSVSAAAQALVNDANRERVTHGRAPLARDAALDRIAFQKAYDMAVRRYFGHTSPDGVTFYDRMRVVHWETAYVAENLAFDRTEPDAHRAFVTSPPHYANLIDPNQRRIGVAVVNVGAGETFFVEEFSQ